MAKEFALRIVTAEGSLPETPVTYCSLQLPEGSLGVLANHAPMLCALPKGELFYRTQDGGEHRLRHSAGIAVVRDNTVTLLVDSAEENGPETRAGA